MKIMKILDGMDALNSSFLTIIFRSLGLKSPVICVKIGFQWLFESSCKNRGFRSEITSKKGILFIENDTCFALLSTR
jgi:hypothetical protein